MATKKPVKKAAKPAAKKPAAKKVVAKKAAAPKAAAVSKPKKIGPVTGKPLTKSEVQSVIAEHAGISKKQAGDALDCLTEVICAHLKKGACGHIKLNGLLNIKTVTKPARKARKGVNPFTGEEIMIKARPAHKAVKVSALKQLKEMVD